MGVPTAIVLKRRNVAAVGACLATVSAKNMGAR